MFGFVKNEKVSLVCDVCTKKKGIVQTKTDSTMNRLSTSFFGQLFYLRNGLFATKGLQYAQEHGSYYEIFSVGSMKHSSFHFKMLQHTKVGEPSLKFGFESTLDLNGKYWEHYKFETSPPYGANETYDLYKIKDSWFEKPLLWSDVQRLAHVLKQGQHIVHDSSCFTK